MVAFFFFNWSSSKTSAEIKEGITASQGQLNISISQDDFGKLVEASSKPLECQFTIDCSDGRVCVEGIIENFTLDGIKGTITLMALPFPHGLKFL